MFRWGILSTAKIGREHVVPAIFKAQGSTLAAIASRDLESAQAYAAQFQIPHAFGSYEAMLGSDVIDGVYIPLVTSLHVEWAIKAAQAGKHVLVEKPLALNAADIAPVIAARDAHGVIVSEAFMVTYHPQWHKVRDLISAGAIGTLRQVDGAFTYFNRDAENMRNRPELGGGVIPDIGVYPTVTTRFATGKEPVKLHASVEFDPDFGTDRYASVRADYGSFEQTFYLSTQLANRQHMAFHGDKGFIEVICPFNSNLYEGDEVRLHNAAHNEAQSFRYTGIDQYQCQIEAFTRAVAGDGAAFSLEDSVKNQRVLDAIYASGRSGGWEAV